jgi:hypothetical protein
MPPEALPKIKDLNVLAHDRSYSLAHWRGHILSVWRNSPDETTAEHLRRVTVESVRQVPRQLAYFAVVLASASVPSEPGRTPFIRMGAEVGDGLCCMAVVYEAHGFGGAALRGVVTGLAFAARIRFPLKSFEFIEPASVWTASRIPPGPHACRAEELTQAARYLRDRPL